MQHDYNPESTIGRRGLILKMLDEQGQVNVTDLCAHFKVSAVTIRNDLSNLEQKKLLIRARGGAIKTDKVTLDLKISGKQGVNIREKEAIGRRAARYVQEGDTIFIGSGTTTREMVHHLNRFNNLTVITNALNIAGHLADMERLTVIVPGGIMRHNILSLVGAMAIDNFKKFFCDKLFIAADGIDVNLGLSSPDLEEAALNRTMIKMARKVIVVADSSKFGKRSLAVICGISQIDVLITDSGLSALAKEALENMGVEVVIAD
ncbi:DeoR/GlpR family DNA-binding transcription regulator [Alkalitalea saponilacus]|uniref:Transcriptional regulator, DeoR family n=1 Tax=Alkalitalea saponilacus TaxID=889453 RepID=A0A1T5F7R9_9BACT|nr:DeoR/GlpR family DNA-binding transcription regulator [Alkalitalea saponilacus]ASB50146.1 DeoR family transcriptional regulator [Alkalitalea saponilacus]SKB92215.1 transcriptional regulator, DeoR family [Alkalitalea saponilacus]